MKKISITDISIRQAAENNTLGFKEKLEIAKVLDKLNISAIEVAPLNGSKADSIFIKTLSSLIHDTALSVPVGMDRSSALRAWEAVCHADRPRLIVDMPVSSVQMEYIARKKPDDMLKLIDELVSFCASLCPDVEFCATDATRAEESFLEKAVFTAIDAGAGSICLCDTAGILLPNNAGSFLNCLYENVPQIKKVFVKMMFDNSLELAGANTVSALCSGVSGIKTTMIGTAAPQLRTICGILRHQGENLGLYSTVKATELDRALHRIKHMTGADVNEKSASYNALKNDITYEHNDTISAVSEGVRALGYELSQEDLAKVYEEFLRVSAKKPVGQAELDAIVAASAMQVPSTYVLENYVINSGSIITNTACVRLSRNGQSQEGLSSGDGPIDAAFKAMETVTGQHYDLEDFHIDAVTEGKEAIGRAVVRLRCDGRLYSGSGISTDIVSAAIRAYLGALNKIVYEESEE